MYTGKEGVIGRVGRSILVGQGAIEFLCFDLYRSTSTGRAEHWPHSIREIAVVVVAVVAVVVVVTRIVAVVGPCWGRNLQKHHVEQTGVALSTAVARRRRDKCKPAMYLAELADFASFRRVSKVREFWSHGSATHGPPHEERLGGCIVDFVPQNSALSIPCHKTTHATCHDCGFAGGNSVAQARLCKRSQRLESRGFDSEHAGR